MLAAASSTLLKGPRWTGGTARWRAGRRDGLWLTRTGVHRDQSFDEVRMKASVHVGERAAHRVAAEDRLLQARGVDHCVQVVEEDIAIVRRLGMSEAWDDPTVDDGKDCPLGFHRSVGGFRSIPCLPGLPARRRSGRRHCQRRLLSRLLRHSPRRCLRDALARTFTTQAVRRSTRDG